jgi:hypothetical protein
MQEGHENQVIPKKEALWVLFFMLTDIKNLRSIPVKKNNEL